MAEEKNRVQPEETGEFSPETEMAGVDLESARLAYEMALRRLLDQFPDLIENLTHRFEAEDHENSLIDLTWSLIRFLFSFLTIFWVIFRAIWFVIRETGEDFRAALFRNDAQLKAKTRSNQRIQRLLLEALWARDYLQYILEQPEPVPYHIKRDTLRFLIENDDLLDRLRLEAIERADLDPVKLRKAQPTPPSPEAWWWFLDNRRTKRARRLNAFWFVVAIFPALAAIILITLLTQRLAVGGLDVLSGASAFAQLILGAGSILAGRELLDSFFFDRSSGRSWQGEITFVLALLFLTVVAGFYLLAPPAAAQVYNWFGQQAIDDGNAAEAELYLESATRLDPDPHAGNLVEVGCLYLTLGAPDRAQSVFERVLEADSRLLMARYHLSEIYTDQEEYNQALQLLADGLNLLNNGRDSLQTDGDDTRILPLIDTTVKADQVEYLLRLSFGSTYLEANSYQQAKSNLASAERLLAQLEQANAVQSRTTKTVEVPCVPNDLLAIYIDSTRLELKYFQARTFDAICASDADDSAARAAWNFVLRSRASNNQQEAYVAEASARLTNFTSCQELKTANAIGGE